jgi:putative CocE/NonD family hydrolase
MPTFTSMLERRILRWLIVALLGAIAQSQAVADGSSTEPIQSRQEPSIPDAAKIDFHWGVKIPMRDGIKLNGTLYTPKDQKGPAPCILTLTPYISATYHPYGVAMAAHGLPYLVVDVRGRGNSEGEKFEPYVHEALDGYDIVEWLARQPYCNGKVGMWGGSYTGFDQWDIAREFPPHLATIVPAAAAYPSVDTPMFKNIFYLSDTQWWPTVTAGRAAQEGIDDSFWEAKYREWYESGAPFKDLARIVGNARPEVFQEWISHPQQGAYWDAYVPTPEQYAKMDIPILSITGSYDNTQSSALTFYRNHMRYASSAERARHYLLIGPWDHMGTHAPKADVDGLHFGPASLVDLDKLHVDWYLWTMQGGQKPEFLQKQVAYYVMGAEKWRYADTLEGITAQSIPYFLDSTTNADDPFASGSLRPGHAGSATPDHYVYDPRVIRKAKPPREPGLGGLVSQSVIFDRAPGWQLVYHTAPFEHDAEISGFFKLAAWLSIDQPDTDFSVSIYAIDTEGRSVFLSNDVVRARYREGLRKKEQLIHTTAALRYDFEGFTFVSRLIRKGERLRLTVGPVDPLDMGMEKNFNSGGVVTEESMKDARTVTVKLFHDRDHPTALYVPIAQPQRAGEPQAPPGSLLPRP